jgi:hypothetical protein
VARAWAASALLHVLLVLVFVRVARRTEPAPPAVVPPSIEITVEESAPATAPAPPAPALEPAPARPPPGRERGGGTRASGAAREIESPSSVEAPPAGPGAPTGPPPAGPPPAGPPIDLSLGSLSPGQRSAIAGPPSEDTLRALGGRPSLEERRAAVERAEDAVANVERGRVDPLLYDYLRGAKARVHTEARRLADRLPLGPKQTVRTWAGGYLQRVDEVNRTIALGTETGAEGPDLRTDAERRRPDIFAGYDEGAHQADAGAEERRAEVCLDVAPGRETTVALRRSSGNAALDRVATAAFANAAAARPVPEGARAGRACYELTIRAFRMPPLPAISCGVGEDGFTCVWPFKKITQVRGHLLSVDYGTPPDAKRSLLRRPR